MLDACVAPANEIEEGLVSRESALFSCQADQQAVSLRPCLRRPSTRSVSRETAGAVLGIGPCQVPTCTCLLATEGNSTPTASHVHARF
jgi:hypothetical protein